MSDIVLNFGKSKFQLASEVLTDEGLKNAGVSDPLLVKSLGMFGFVFFVLLILTGLFFILKSAHKAIA